MLCNYSTQTGKSGSNWLDRLRSNKGFPTDDYLDLDSFLLTVSSTPHSPLPRPQNPTPIHPPDALDPPMRTVLAQLFLGSTQSYTKKCPRKQTNPKFFLASAATATANPPAPDQPADDLDDNHNDDHDFNGFSRSEVTVIDTSSPGWKVDKFVFRKNNVWKVRERKPKSNFFAKKKSKTIATVNGADGIGTSV